MGATGAAAMSFSHFARSGNFTQLAWAKKRKHGATILKKLPKFATQSNQKEWKVASASVATAHGTLSRLSWHLPALEASKSVINLLVVRDGFLLHGFLHTQTCFTSHPQELLVEENKSKVMKKTIILIGIWTMVWWHHLLKKTKEHVDFCSNFLPSKHDLLVSKPKPCIS